MEGYEEEHEFLSLARKFGKKYGINLMNTAINTKNIYGKKNYGY